MPRLRHPTTGRQVHVRDSDAGLLRYYRREGYAEPGDSVIGERGPQLLDFPGTEVPLSEEAETDNPLDSSEQWPAGDPLDQEGDQA